jgi:hypothetical protein
MTIDERIEALVMTVELLSREVEILRATVAEDAKHIRALARIAEIDEYRLTDLEGGPAT